MTIHAVYENGVFRPMDKVALPDRCEVEVEIRQVKERSEIPVLQHDLPRWEGRVLGRLTREEMFAFAGVQAVTP
jgi:predicted DNA-binding antitoxin AbrB/MazE fold protein